MVIRKRSVTRMQVELDNLRAENARLKADMDYVAMMTDVEIEDDEEEREGGDEQAL